MIVNIEIFFDIRVLNLRNDNTLMRFKKFPCDRQLDMMDCGPACLKMVARYYGKFYSMQFLRDKCGITREGVSLLDMGYAAESIGLHTLSVRVALKDLINKIPLPCILHWQNSHFVVLYSITKRKAFVSDPAKGLVTYTHQQFLDGWIKPNSDQGVVMALEPMADFSQLEEAEKKQRTKTFQSTLAYFLPYKTNFATIGIVMLLSTFLQAILPFISKAVIDVGIQTRDIDFINMVLIANVMIILSMTMSNVVRDWILMHIASRVNISLISDYLIKLMKLPVTFFENKMVGDILQRANDHERIRSFVMNNSLNLIFSAITFLVFAIILLIYNAIIFYIFLAGSFFYVAWIMIFLRIRKKLDWEYFELISKNQSYWVETVESIQEIKVNNYERPRRWRWETIQAKLYRVNLRVLSVNNAQGLGAQFIESVKNLIITFYCARAVISGDITFGVMISTQFIIGMLNGPIVQLVGFVQSFQYAKISFLRLNEVHQLADEDELMGNDPISLPLEKSLHVKNVSFQYTPNGSLVLKNVNLSIPEGKITAIVGNSGCGKSTLLKVLLRLYQPSYGEIYIGNMHINNVSLRQWREKCGVVLQDGKVFNDTVIRNIVLGDGDVDHQRLKEAVQIANISDDIEQLPLGYQTMLGEQGKGLSGGQKQRLLIARALYKNPDYLFLDEATNALDAINEQKIVRALNDASVGRTVLVIAHRLSTIRNADQIVVMKGGMVVEIGTHNSLMALKRFYYELVSSQIGMESDMVSQTVMVNGKDTTEA